MRKATATGVVIGGVGLVIGLVGIWLWLRCRNHHKSHHKELYTDADKRDHDCPEWINCMPGPGRGPCTIPEGCEGITQIAH
jgi:hypothetical protein